MQKLEWYIKKHINSAFNLIYLMVINMHEFYFYQKNA